MELVLVWGFTSKLSSYPLLRVAAPRQTLTEIPWTQVVMPHCPETKVFTRLWYQAESGYRDSGSGTDRRGSNRSRRAGWGEYLRGHGSWRGGGRHATGTPAPRRARLDPQFCKDSSATSPGLTLSSLATTQFTRMHMSFGPKNICKWGFSLFIVGDHGQPETIMLPWAAQHIVTRCTGQVSAAAVHISWFLCRMFIHRWKHSVRNLN